MNTDARSAAVDLNLSKVERASLGWRAWFLILSISFAVCCFRLGDARTLTEHEIRVAGSAKQMALDHEWFLPKIGDRLWLEKPPLLHWLVIVSAKLLGGFSETAARLPSVLAGLGVVVLMTKLAFGWFGARVAIFTALVQTTTVHFITYARLAEPDMLLAFIVVLALFVFVRLHSIGDRWPIPHRHTAVLFWGLTGLSNMVKGLGFGPVLILVPCVAFLILKRDPVAWRRMICWPGLALGLGLALAWQIVVALYVPEAQELWRVEIAGRVLGTPQYDQPWWYYLSTVPWQLLPWTPSLLIAAAPSLVRAKTRSDSPDRFIWCWAILPIALLTLARGKHHHYIISCLCAFSPLCALGLLRCGTRLAVASVALAVGGILFVNARIMPARDRCRDDTEFLKTVRSLVPPETPLVVIGGVEVARSIFYIEPPPQAVSNPGDLERRFSGIRFYLIARRGEESGLKKLGRVDVITESRHTRNEQTPADRFTLFRIQPGSESATRSPEIL